MAGLTQRPFAFALAVTTWGQALARVRTRSKFNISHSDIAKWCGVGKDLVRDWEMGLAVPTRDKLRRLYGRFPDLRYYTYLLPQEMQRAPAVEAKDEAQNFVPEQAKGDAPPEVAAPEPVAKTFGQALRQVRLAHGLHQWELATLTGLKQTMISSLENDDPANREAHARLLALMPELQTAPVPKWAPRTYTNPGHRKGAPPNTQLRSVPPAPAPAPAAPPPPAPAAKPAPTAGELGAAYGEALQAVAAARQRAYDLHTQAASADQDAKAAEDRADEALQRLNAATGRS